MFKRIVVGVDGSPASITASKYAFKMGNFYDVPVVGIYVIDVRLLEESFLADLAGVLGFTYYEGISGKIKDFLEKQGDTILTEFSSLGREYGAKVSVVQTSGVPYREIASQADPEDLIVLGRVGRKPISGILIGSNSEKVARHAKCPVFLVPEEERELKRALVAYDGSENAKLSLRICRSLRSLYNYEINVLSVQEEEEEVKRIEEEVRELLPEEHKFFYVSGLPEERIVSFAKDEGIDVLFLGAYGKGRFKELFLGSVTSFVIHHLDIPMFLAKVPMD
ncbi:nucleotide-binding universal stress UspA family protein [Hydrogenivirga caldilitoris]|uniref:Nucleotide-binding universal stress UspA family protein n=1 Tax=Hydrogenivirga caldilitoris TaxID=246264 RepID=A0A497XNW8_9AQUI|nr:universal stress protein [Hydrogenivirga caldilitoris]RLJ69830.1 nucleotide-binding universal stress UspA family protein [Hydrogenivirga caldilitoris]